MATRYRNGNIQDFEVWNRVLTRNEIQELYQAKRDFYLHSWHGNFFLEILPWKSDAVIHDG